MRKSSRERDESGCKREDESLQTGIVFETEIIGGKKFMDDD